MKIAKFQFRPALLPTVVTLLLLPLLVSLGFWQLDRAAQKRRLAEHFQSRSEDPPVRLDGAQVDAQAMKNRRIVATGRYRSDRQILLDNQIHRSRAGYHVLTPFQLIGADVVVLVNRGWVPLGRDRTTLPDISVTETELTLTGLVHLPSGPPIRLPDSGDAAPGWPKVVQRIEIAPLAERMDEKLLPYTVRLAPDQDHGYVRDWRVYYGPGPGKHQAYAAQWFGLALVLLVLYFLLNTRRPAQTGSR